MKRLSITTKTNLIKGFTFVEMLVAIALSSVCIGVGALALQSITSNAKRTTSIIEIDIGTTNNQNFYGKATSKIRTYEAPNFGKIAFAQQIRSKLNDDASRSTAVFCLPRSLPNSVRPAELTYPGGTAFRPDLDSPDSFRQFLINYDNTAEAIFGTAQFRSVPTTSQTGTSIFLLGPSSDVDKIAVNAIYEIDLISPSNFSGTYASVRRYVGTQLTHYYDIFYKSGTGDAFHPQFVAFEQISRSLGGEATNISKFQIAPRSPFYMVFLPDPSINPYEQPKWTAVDSASSPRADYEKMTGKTSFVTVLPMFPTL